MAGELSAAAREAMLRGVADVQQGVQRVTLHTAAPWRPLPDRADITLHRTDGSYIHGRMQERDGDGQPVGEPVPIRVPLRDVIAGMEDRVYPEVREQLTAQRAERLRAIRDFMQGGITQHQTGWQEAARQAAQDAQDLLGAEDALRHAGYAAWHWADGDDGAIVAAAGWCAPSEDIRTMRREAELASRVRLAMGRADEELEHWDGSLDSMRWTGGTGTAHP